MKKLLIYLDDDRHEDLKELAHLKKTTMASLVRFAIEETFEDELDAVLGKRRLEEHLNHPESGISFDDHGIVLPHRNGTGNRAGSKANAAKGR
jgi:hypothetical protein